MNQDKINKIVNKLRALTTKHQSHHSGVLECWTTSGVVISRKLNEDLDELDYAWAISVTIADSNGGLCVSCAEQEGIDGRPKISTVTLWSEDAIRLLHAATTESLRLHDKEDNRKDTT